MTRFKDLRRIEQAIKHKNKSELLWSLSYCEDRFKYAKMKEHEKHWRKMIHKVENAIKEIDEI